MFAPSIIYAPGDPWVTLQRRLALLPAIPISGEGRAAFEPIWADDVARCVLADLDAGPGSRRHEVAGPERLTYEQIARLIARSAGRERPVIHVPLGLVHYGSPRCGEWSATLSSPPGRRRSSWRCRWSPSAPTCALGVEPRRMAGVLGGGP